MAKSAEIEQLEDQLMAAQNNSGGSKAESSVSTSIPEDAISKADVERDYLLKSDVQTKLENMCTIEEKNQEIDELK